MSPSDFAFVVETLSVIAGVLIVVPAVAVTAYVEFRKRQHHGDIGGTEGCQD